MQRGLALRGQAEDGEHDGEDRGRVVVVEEPAGREEEWLRAQEEHDVDGGDRDRWSDPEDRRNGRRDDVARPEVEDGFAGEQRVLGRDPAVEDPVRHARVPEAVVRVDEVEWTEAVDDEYGEQAREEQ